jgi:hypothetical protein
VKSSGNHSSGEEKLQDFEAQFLAKRIRREARLREIVEEPAMGFFIGESLVGSVLRIAGCLVLGFLYIRSNLLEAYGVWPVLVLAGLVESFRANRRLDALLELEKLATEEAKRQAADRIH